MRTALINCGKSFQDGERVSQWMIFQLVALICFQVYYITYHLSVFKCNLSGRIIYMCGQVMVGTRQNPIQCEVQISVI